MIQLNKALFLDLDGTLVNTKSGETFPKDVNDWVFIDGVLSSLRRYSDQGYLLCIVSNQGGIALGKVLESDVDLRLNLIRKEIEDYVKKDVMLAYCPYMDGYFRKPNPGMAYHFAIELKINLRTSIMVGNSPSDNEFAVMAGIGAYLHVDQFRDHLEK